MTNFFALLLSLALATAASAVPDAQFDGARLLGAGVAIPVGAGAQLPPSELRRLEAATEPSGEEVSPPHAVAKGPPTAPSVPSAPVTVAPSSFRGLTSGFLGLYPESDFELGTGRCVLCRAPE